MPQFKVTLEVPVCVTAHCDITIGAQDEEQAWAQALDAYKGIVAAYDKAMREYRQAPASHKWPDPTYYWHVDDDDIESNLDETEIDVGTIREIK